MAPSHRPLRVLLAEDSADDAELLLFELRRAGFDPSWVRVDAEPEYRAQLSRPVDLVLSDYSMPQFSGFRALEILKELKLEIPFILVSGTIGEELAVSAMKLGAADYLLKDRLSRLGPAVLRALEESHLRRQSTEAEDHLQKSEQRLRKIFDGILAFVGLFSLDGRILEMNDAALKTVGANRADLLGQLMADGPWWSESLEMRERVESALRHAARGETVKLELIARTQGNDHLVIDAVFNPLRDASGEITAIVGSGIDVTARKAGEQKIQDQLNELLRWQEVIMNREDRVQVLKAEVNELLVQRGFPQRYTGAGSP
ncbi:MAG: PAS domain-containing protein [Opitutus sp.]